MSASAVITAWGCLGPWGGAQGLRDALRDGIVRSSVVDRSQGFHAVGTASRALLVSDDALMDALPRGELRRASRLSRMTMAAAHDAGAARPDDPGTTLVLSTCFGPVHASVEVMSTILRDGPLAVAPYVFAESVANAPAAQLAIATGARGPNLTIVQAEASPLLALGRGRVEIESGRASRVLVGALDEAPPMLHACLGRLGALARPGSDGEECARPFRASRTGVVQAEGASILTLSEESTARAKGAPLLARVLCSGSAFDPSASRLGWGTGAESLGRALTRSLARARLRLSVGDIGLIVSGASGSVAGDALEARTLRAAWDHVELPPIVTPKAFTGEWGGGGLAAAMAIVTGCDVAEAPEGAPEGATGEAADEAVPPHGDLPLHRGGALPPARLLLLTAFGSGGSAAWVVLERL